MNKLVNDLTLIDNIFNLTVSQNGKVSKCQIFHTDTIDANANYIIFIALFSNKPNKQSPQLKDNQDRIPTFKEQNEGIYVTS